MNEDTAEKWLLLLLVFGFGLSTFSFAFSKGLFKKFKEALPLFIEGKYVLAGFTLFITIQLIVVPVLSLIFLLLLGWNLSEIENLTPLAKGWLNFFVILGGFVALSMVFFMLNGLQRRQLFGETNASWNQNLFLGAAIWFVVFPFVLVFSEIVDLVVWFFFHHTRVEQIVVQKFKQTFNYPWLFSLTAVEIITIVPLSEEFLFRGLLQNWLKKRLGGPFWGVVCSAAIFASFHFSPELGLSNIQLLSSLFMLGCALGFLYERQRSLWAPIGLHSFFNLMSLFFLFIS